MSQIRFTCTQLKENHKKGVLKPVSDGYYDLVIGGLNIYNSAGMKYTAEKEVLALFQNSSSFMRKVKRGALYGEVGHPKFLPGMTKDQFIDRILTVDEKNICVHFAEIYLDFDSFKNADGTPVIAIRAITGPGGPKGDFLAKQMANPKENLCFSIRSFTEDYYKAGVLCRDIKTIITFDYVTEPGIHIAEKYKNPALEELSQVSLNKTDFERYYDRQVVGVGQESAPMTKEQLFSCFGWQEKRSIPKHHYW